MYAIRWTNNPYTTLKGRSYQSKQSSRIHRVDSYDNKKTSSHEDDKTCSLTNLRRKSLSSCDLFHATTKTLTSPFDEIQNWFNINKCKSVMVDICSFEISFVFRYSNK